MPPKPLLPGPAGIEKRLAAYSAVSKDDPESMRQRALARGHVAPSGLTSEKWMGKRLLTSVEPLPPGAASRVLAEKPKQRRPKTAYGLVSLSSGMPPKPAEPIAPVRRKPLPRPQSTPTLIEVPSYTSVAWPMVDDTKCAPWDGRSREALPAASAMALGQSPSAMALTNPPSRPSSAPALTPIGGSTEVPEPPMASDSAAAAALVERAISDREASLVALARYAELLVRLRQSLRIPWRGGAAGTDAGSAWERGGSRVSLSHEMRSEQQQRLSQLLLAQRLCGLRVVEAVTLWRRLRRHEREVSHARISRAHSRSHKLFHGVVARRVEPPYVWNNHNYLIKMTTDQPVRRRLASEPDHPSRLADQPPPIAPTRLASRL